MIGVILLYNYTDVLTGNVFFIDLITVSGENLNITVIKSDCGSVSPTYQVTVEVN